MSNSEIVNMIKKNIENLNETISIVESTTKDTDAIEEALDEITVLESFMPVQMSETEIENAIVEIINETGASSMQDMGRVMGMFTKQYAGKADNKLASSIIKSRLQ